ncbi:MAG TPA: tyrosine recombinase XerC [Hungateiclostridium thermocellum]|jgi:integrase/recombinase XerD|uniref:Integrase family protein n=2 Tax=Acetivibrio thermocellus TaxID=1515 RepID=A3DDD4_ACET2|nr:tyrosine recombinase XerC [Acetivibrio thermocellus]CDG35421.1 Tyrosine recombinase XerC [Acetivibrio thermocellus BC1]ABN51963.1 integrase family protein [Acetivibrio thermocellus ATCC 27405]ADU74557.1 integrase family protein [Acetivibrio thermocellus DSM 1313]ALX08501.1 Tyrosine recombinase xerC [Acetivibrio thermocellus AD2]ANV76250.1 Tyrosine recombinase xerC [Acetivibrio thermocellus DSM 2360]
MNGAYYGEAPAIIKDFLSYMETIRGKSKNTIHEYYYDLRLFFRFMKIHFGLEDSKKDFDSIDIKDMDIDVIKKITLSDIYSFMSFLSRERDNTASSRARKVASIRSFFNYLTNKAKLLEQNPAAELESPKIMKRLPRYLNIEESKRLLGSIDGEHKERDFAIITLFLNCGLRLSELVNINLSNIKNDVLTVVGKGNKERTIYLNAACKKALDAYLKVRPVDGVKDKNALFLSSRKQRISNKTVQHIVKKYIKAAGLDPERYSTHKLRHTAATLMYKHGNVDIRALQEILGHESIATTEIYTHVDSQQLKNAVESNPLSTYVDEHDNENES